MTCLLAIAALAAPLRSDVYKWTDEKGAVHYSNTPPQKPGTKARKLDKGSVSSYAPSSGGPSDGKLEYLKGVKGSGLVEMYVTSWCPACKSARASLQASGTPFVEYDIESDPSALARAKSLGYAGSIPFVVVNGQGRTGYSKSWVDAALAR